MVNVVAMAAAPDERVPGMTAAVPSNKEASDSKGRRQHSGSWLARSPAIVLVSLMIKVIGVENGYGVHARPLT